jgi:hypothetical protein
MVSIGSFKPMKEVLLEKFVDFSIIAQADFFFWKMTSVTEMANPVATCVPNV